MAETAKYRVKTLTVEDYQAAAACQGACPLGTDTKRYVRAITEGDYEKAYLIARQTNPLVSVCSRVCTAPCEKSCRKADEGGAVDIRALKRFACDRNEALSPASVAQRLDRFAQETGLVSDKTGNHILRLLGWGTQAEKGMPSGPRVAIIGSGPAGLSAAHDLALLGYRVTILEGGPVAGGQLMTGIPEFRLPKEIVQKEIDGILSLGVELKLGTPVGERLTLSDLREQGFQAIFFTIGLQHPLKLTVEGSDLKGVCHGIDYVRDHRRITLEKNCIVIGGGGVAIDCAQHAVRQGAEKVTVACLESWEAMPASQSDKEDAQEEGIGFLTGLGPRRIVGKDGKVTGIEFMKVSSLFDAEGRFNPSFVPGSEMLIQVDAVILAVGQASSLPSLAGVEGLDTTPNGLIRANEDMSTNLPGVFAGGDVRWRFGRTATEAIADGQKAARAIHGYLTGAEVKVRKKGYLRAVTPEFSNTRCDTIRPVPVPKRPAAQRVKTGEEITLGFDEAQARQQAARCRQCSIHTVFDGSRCLRCGTCADTCVRGALKLVRLARVEGDEKFQKLLGTLQPKPGSGKGMTAIIKDDSRCVSCGTCASRCPGQAITMAEFFSEEEWEQEVNS